MRYWETTGRVLDQHNHRRLTYELAERPRRPADFELTQQSEATQGQYHLWRVVVVVEEGERYAQHVGVAASRNIIEPCRLVDLCECAVCLHDRQHHI